MKKIFFIIISVFSIYNLTAQKCTIELSGQLLDLHDKSPLGDALIEITGLSKITKTDSNGNFSFKNLCAGTYELEISHPQCATAFKTFKLKKDKHIKISLEHHLEQLKEVLVSAKITKTNSSNEQQLSVNELDNSSGTNLGEALSNLSGVSSIQTGNSIVKPVIQGLNGSRVLIMNQGVRMQDMEWGEEHAPNIDLNSVGTVSLIKGAAALEYGGDAIGGVILTESKKNILKDSLFGYALINGISNGKGGNTAVSVNKSYKSGWFTNAHASFKRLGDTKSPDYYLSNTGIQEIGASFKIGKQNYHKGFHFYYSYYNANIGILSSSHIGNVDDLINAINGEQPLVLNEFSYNIENPNQKIQHHLAKLAYYQRIKNLGKWSFQYDFQRNNRKEFDIRIGDNAGKASIDLQLDTHSFSTDLKWDFSSDLNLKTGLLLRYQKNFPNPATGVKRLIPDYQKYDLGVFALSDYYLNEKWTVDAGIRIDISNINAKKYYALSRWEERNYQADFGNDIIQELESQILVNPILDFAAISFTGGFKYNLGLNNTIRFNYAQSERAPNPAELFSDGLHHSAARIELGDLRMTKERAHKIGVSIEGKRNNFSYTVSPFLNYISNFIVLEPTGTEFTIRGAFPVWTYRQTDARLMGIDADFYYNWSNKFSSKHQFSLVKGKDISKNTALINIPAVETTNGITYNLPSKHNFSLTVENSYVFKQNEYPPNIRVFSPEQQQEVVLEINTPPAAYSLWKIQSSMLFPLKKGVLKTSLQINNVFNTKYRDYLNRQRYFTDDLGRNINLLVKYNF